MDTETVHTVNLNSIKREREREKEQVLLKVLIIRLAKKEDKFLFFGRKKMMMNVAFLFLLLSKFIPSNGSPPGIFIFGDSLSDSGNNNFIPTFVKSNYPPYGIDFPQGPTGRFSNGKLAVDIIGDLLRTYTVHACKQEILPLNL